MYVVIGGGAAGCAAAFVLQRAGRDVTVLEATADIGGRTRTVWRDGFGVEVGAIYMLNSYERALALLESAGAADSLEAWSPLAGLWDGRALHPMRYDYIPSFFTLPMLSVTDKLRLMWRALQAVVSPAPEPFETDSLAAFDRGEDMESWARRRLGDTLFECFVRPLIEPSFGTDCRDLSVPYLQGIMKRAHRAKFFLPRGGMGELCAALTRDVKVELQTEVETVDAGADKVEVTTSAGEVLTAEGVVVATDATSTASILASSLDGNSRRTLTSAPYTSMAHVNLRWDEDPWPDNRFEMLLPVGPGPRPLLGTIVKTSQTSRLIPHGSRMTDSYFSSEATRSLSDEELISIALQHVRDIYGRDVPDPVAEVFSMDRALAVSPPGHYRAMKRVRDSLPPRIGIAGDYLAHLGVETAVVSGERAAQRLLTACGNPSW